MWRSAPLLVVGVWSLACAGRKAGPHPDETVAWVVADVRVESVGCDDAAPFVDAAARNFDVGAGLVYRTNADATSVEGQSCPLADGAFDLEACEGDGAVGSVAGDTLTWDLEEVVVDDAPCLLTIAELREIVDEGFEGTLSTLVTIAAAAQRDCGYTFEGEPVAPDGCEITVEADLELSAAERKL